MSGTLMARLFIVPAIIVCLMLAVAVVVVLFGSTAIDQPETVDQLLAKIELDTGERTLGTMLLPAARESWQAAQELARRFEQRDKFLPADQIEPTATRLIAILDKFGVGRDETQPAPDQQYFVMLALGHLKSPLVIEPLAKRLSDPNAATRRTAMQALAEMKGLPEARSCVTKVLPLLNDPRQENQLVACATIASLAGQGDELAVRALTDRLDGPPEVAWNAAMCLARLGSRRGKLVLMNMLDRGYWEAYDLNYTEGEPPVQISRRFADGEVSRNLCAAIDAAKHIADAELAVLVQKLESDKAVVVREAARKARGGSEEKAARRSSRASDSGVADLICGQA
jgi:HEAT repeat protein